jgi:hypothetical protein
VTAAPEMLRTGPEAVLCWAAGRSAPPPYNLVLDDEVVLDLVDRHALSGRLLRRLDGAPLPLWMSSNLYRGLTGLYADAQKMLDLHAAATAEMAAELGDPSEPVLVKGISTYLVTGEPHTIRCGDIDLVCADGDRLIEVLTRLGYRRTRDPFLHEAGEFTRGLTEVDLHSYFPVYSYAGLGRSDLNPADHDGIWHQHGYRMPLNRIGYQDLAQDRIRRSVGTTGQVSVPDPCLLAIILCAHAFMNFTNVWSISHRAKPYVRLAELADLHDLVRHEAFDRGRFLRLVQHFDATDAVQWTGWASTILTGGNVLPAPTSQPVPDTFPRCLWWSLWADIPVAPESLVRPWWLDLADFVPTLGDSVVDLVNGASGRLAVGAGGGLLPADPTTQLRRQVQQASATPMPPWTVEIGSAHGGLTVAVGLPPRQAAPIERVRVDFGRVATEWSLTAETGRTSITGDQVDCTLGRDEHGRRLELRYDTSSLGCSADRISLLVGIAEEDHAGSFTSTVLLPLTVRFDRPAVGLRPAGCLPQRSAQPAPASRTKGPSW